MTDSTVKVVYDSKSKLMIVLGDNGVELSRAEAEKLFIDLGHALQDQDQMKESNQ